MSYEVINGDMRIAVPMLEPGFDSCVTDCPYELNFMGKSWDRSGISFQVGTWRAAYEALKPGAHLLAFGGTRTVHRIACAIEDAGFEIRDQIQWLYGSGMPKGRDISKAIGRAAGGAEQWAGWNTTLKPGHEPIVVARKPLSESTVEGNVLKYGTGGINVGACRIAIDPSDDIHSKNPHTVNRASNQVYGAFRAGSEYEVPEGRWPANVILTHSPECEAQGLKRVKGTKRPGRNGSAGAFGRNGIYGRAAGDGQRAAPTYADEDGSETVESWECAPGCSVRLLNEQSGALHGAGNKSPRAGVGDDYELSAVGFRAYKGPPTVIYRDSGGASRFYYCAKASQEERRGGNHPTVKPVALMRYLVRLVTPKGGRVLDPFAGTFKTGEACVIEGFDFTGIDLEEANCETGRLRLARASGQFVELPRAVKRQIETPLFGGAG